MGKWVPSDAVAALEAEYDDLIWDHVDPESTHRDRETGWTWTSVLRPDGHGDWMTVRRQFGQPMFMLREESEAGPSMLMDNASYGDLCIYCRDGRGHWCGGEGCGAAIDHMTGAICPTCWSQPYDDDELPLLRLITE